MLATPRTSLSRCIGFEEGPDMIEARAHTARQFRSASTYAELQELLRDMPKAADPGLIADVLAECATPGDTLIVGVTGSVAAGKTNFCSAVASVLRSTMRVEIVSTDGFLFPNNVLTQRGLLLQKGNPETYDVTLLSGALQRVRWGAVQIPGYSHAAYDRAPELDRTINRPDIVLVEGLGLSPTGKHRDPSALLDLLIYLDASERDLESWYVNRFMEFWRDAGTNASSFYTRFRSMSAPEAEDFARMVWTNQNLPNLRENIAPALAHADLLISKSTDHSMTLTMPGLARRYS